MKRISIVTGSSSGMGECFARLIAEETVTSVKKRKENFITDELWLIARREDRLEKVKESIENYLKASEVKCSLTPRIFAMDIGGKAGAEKVRALLEKEASENELTVSLLVNNAGFGTYGEFSATDTEREMDMIDLDCTSLTGITGYALPYMKKGSRIINTASLASFLPLGNFAVYGACKAYVLSFSIALAAELKDRGISVTSLCPGPVSTEFANVASKGARREVRHGLSPEKTVSHCLKASRKGKLYSMFAFKWKFKAMASKFIGRYAGARFTYKYCKRPSN